MPPLQETAAQPVQQEPPAFQEQKAPEVFEAHPAFEAATVPVRAMQADPVFPAPPAAPARSVQQAPMVPVYALDHLQEPPALSDPHFQARPDFPYQKFLPPRLPFPWSCQSDRPRLPQEYLLPEQPKPSSGPTKVSQQIVSDFYS